MKQLDLSNFFKTKYQSQDFANKINQVLGKIFDVNFDLEKTLLEQLGVLKKDKLLQIMRDNSINSHSQEQVKKFLNDIILEISKMSTITLVVAIEPDESMIHSLSEWFVVNVGNQVIFDFKVDSSILGGVQIYYNGKHADYTIKSHFDKLSSEIISQKENPQQIATPHQPTTISQPN